MYKIWESIKVLSAEKNLSRRYDWLVGRILVILFLRAVFFFSVDCAVPLYLLHFVNAS